MNFSNKGMDLRLKSNVNFNSKMANSSYLKVETFAKLCGCSKHTLRFYDKKGLLKPIYIDENSGYRFYDYSQVQSYKTIKKLQNVGFSIKEIIALTNADNSFIMKSLKDKADETLTIYNELLSLIKELEKENEKD